MKFAPLMVYVTDDHSHRFFFWRRLKVVAGRAIPSKECMDETEKNDRVGAREEAGTMSLRRK